MVDDLELFIFSNSSWVIIGGHVSIEKAQEMVATDLDPEFVVDDVQHFWVRYEFMSDDDIASELTTEPEKRPRWWVLHETTKRPKGVVKKATVVIGHGE